MKPIIPLDPAMYQRHPIHGENRIWGETNCYTDVVIELVHALGHDPVACLPFSLAIDFEGDQWTFFKFPDADLLQLYGLDIQELAVWRPLVDHIADLISADRPVLVELDSYFLPDTAGSAYQLAHVKSTVAINEINVQKKHLGYFHNQGYYHLNGKDFDDVFQINGLVHDRMLPPYFEYIKRQAKSAPNPNDQLERSLAILKAHLARVPKHNPFALFKTKFEHDLEWLMEASFETFHSYSFATLRQYGACFELADTYLGWLVEQGVNGVDGAATSFRAISRDTKTLQFQLARCMARKKPLDLSPLDEMAVQWQAGMSALHARFG